MPAANPYLESQVLTASSERLLVMLHDGLIRQAELASEALERGKLDTAHEALARAQEIVAELIASLRQDVDPEFTGNLLELYHFVHRQLAAANLHHRPEPIGDCLAVVRLQREAWAEAIRRLTESGSETRSPESTSGSIARAHSSSNSDWDLNSANSSGKVWKV